MGMPVATMTLAEFIEWENAQPGRKEFHRGEVFAMVGGRRSRGCVVANLTGEIRLALKGSPCRVFSEGMKVQIADDTIHYPDVFVTCDRADLQTTQIFSAPLLVVEVLSPSTQTYDRSRKFTLFGGRALGVACVMAAASDAVECGGHRPPPDALSATRHRSAEP